MCTGIKLSRTTLFGLTYNINLEMTRCAKDRLFLNLLCRVCCFSLTPVLLITVQDRPEDLMLNYWALFDGHAGSGAAVMASQLLHHHIALHLQEVTEILCTPNLLAPTCLGEEPINHHLTPTSQRALTRAASLRGAAGAPCSPGSPPTRFFTEKKISQESLVIGAIENAFKDMVRVKILEEYSLN